MTNIIHATAARYVAFGTIILLSLLALLPGFVHAAMISRSLDLGTSGPDVTTLQTFLAKDSALYPSGLVTGYYGQLTKAAIERFQTQNNLVSQGTPETTGYGRVGPLTLAALNAQMNGGGSTGGSDTYSPRITSLNVSAGSNNTVVSWVSNESATGKVHYQTSFPSLTEGSRTSAAAIGGSVVSDGNFGTVHSITLTGLQSGITYYYVVESVDGSGNQTIIWPKTFQTL